MLPSAAGGAPTLELIDLATFATSSLDLASEISWQRVAP
jgi:hypothetical protein